MTSERFKEADRAMRPVLADLASAGFETDDPYMLPRDRASVRMYAPVLARGLPAVEPWLAKYWIVGGLTSRFINDPAIVDSLISEFERAEKFATADPVGTFQLRSSIADALEHIGAPTVTVDQMAYLLANPPWRSSVILVAMALGKAARKKQTADAAAAALPPVLDDATLGPHAIEGLASGKLAISPDATTELQPLVARYLDSEAEWVRRSAKRALARLEACG